MSVESSLKPSWLRMRFTNRCAFLNSLNWLLVCLIKQLNLLKNAQVKYSFTEKMSDSYLGLPLRLCTRNWVYFVRSCISSRRFSQRSESRIEIIYLARRHTGSLERYITQPFKISHVWIINQFLSVIAFIWLLMFKQ